MRRFSPLAVALIAAALAIPAFAASSSCVAPGAQPLIESSGVTSPARVYFRADVAKAEHYLDMNVSGTSGWAVLPRVGEGTTAVAYRVATRDAKGVETVVSRGQLEVKVGCAAPKLSSEKQIAAAGLIIGSTVEGPALPAGFRCDGVVGQVSAKGELRAYKPCQQEMIQRAAAGNSTATAVTKTASTKSMSKNKTSITADAVLTPGTTRSNNFPHRNGPPPPQPPIPPRRDRPVSGSRP